MVRSAISLLLVGQVCGSETGVLMQSQAEYSQALLSVSEDAQKAGSALKSLRESGARIGKIEESAKQMADSYGAILQQIVDKHSLVDPVTGQAYTPPPLIMTTLSDTFATLETQLENEKTLNQGLVDTSYDHVVSCATRKSGNFTGTGGVDELDAAMEQAKTAHDGCRDQEIIHENTQKKDCGDFDDLVASCQKDYKYYTSYSKNEDSASDSLTTVLVQAGKCESAVKTLAEKAESCDGKQETFQHAFCTFASKLDRVCSQYTTCHSAADADWGSVNTSVHALEASQKIVFKMLRKVMCYITTLSEATADKMPTQIDIKKCQELGSLAGEQIDTTKLDITYTTPPPQDVCDTLPGAHKPGTGKFAEMEYTHTRHDGRVEQVIPPCD